jgi:hypothetical protein
MIHTVVFCGMIQCNLVTGASVSEECNYTRHTNFISIRHSQFLDMLRSHGYEAKIIHKIIENY